MGGSQSGSYQKSSSSSKPVNTAQQISIYRWMQQNIYPLAEGKDTYLSQLINQRVGEEAERLRRLQEQGISEMGGMEGFSGGMANQMLKNTESNQIQSVLGQNLANKQQLQQAALNMIGSIPLSPGTEASSSSSAWSQAGSGGKMAPKMNATQAANAPRAQAPVVGAPQATSQLTPTELAGQTRVTPEMEAQMRAQMNQNTPASAGGGGYYK